MRFAAASRFSAGDYATAASAGANALASTFDAARKSAPDWTTLARTSMNARSTERQAAMKAEADVATAGMKAFGNVKDMQIKGAYALEARKTEIDSRKRMAGRLGALGGFKLPKKPRKSASTHARSNQRSSWCDGAELERNAKIPPGSAEVGGPSTLDPTAASQESVLKEFADQGHQRLHNKPPTNPSSPPADQQVQKTVDSAGANTGPAVWIFLAVSLMKTNAGAKFIAYTRLQENGSWNRVDRMQRSTVSNTATCLEPDAVLRNVPYNTRRVLHSSPVNGMQAVEIGTARHEPELVNKSRSISQEGTVGTKTLVNTAMQTTGWSVTALTRLQTMLKHRVAMQTDPMYPSTRKLLPPSPMAIQLIKAESQD